MAKVATAPSRAVIDGLRGVLDFYDWCGLHIIRAWPRQHIKTRAPGVVAAQQVFAYAHLMSTTLPANVVQSWQFLASKSNLTWRDWLARAYIGGTLTAPGLPPI